MIGLVAVTPLWPAPGSERTLSPWANYRHWLGVVRLRLLPGRSASEMSDAELLGHLDVDSAFRELVVRHQNSMRRLARSMLRDDGDADEAVQDSLLAAHRHASSFRGEATVRSWLHSICYRQCLARLRRVSLHVVPLDDAINISRAEPGPTLPAYLEMALGTLPVDNQAAFVLVDVLGFSREDAAAVVGVASNTMRARVVRARVLLADLVTDQLELNR